MRSNLVSRASIFAVSAVLLASTGPAHAQVVLDGIVIQSAVGADGDNPADGAGRENVAADTPGLNSTTITQRELDITNPGDLADVFQAVPGITVGSSIPVSQKIYVNGVEETNLQVTIDGSRQNNKIFHHNATTYIDPELLKAVRVYAGVAPADAGPGALGGSIEFETKDVADLLQFGRTAGGSWKGQYESNGNIFVTSGTAYARSNGFEVLGFVKYADGDLRQDGSDEDITGSTTSLLSGLGKLAYQASSGDRFELSYERVQDDAQRPFRADIGAIIGRPADDRIYDLRRQNFVASYTDETPTAWWDPKVVFAYSVTDLEVFEQNFGETSSFNGKAQNRFRFGAHSITIGTDFFRDKTVGDFPLFNEFSEERITNIGSFAQLRLEPNEKLRLSVGGRYDRQWFEGLDGTEISTSGASGNASGEADLTSWLTVNAGVSQKWAGIKLAEPFIFNTAWSYADGIEDATARNAVAGLKLHGNGFSLLGRIFRTNLDDFRAPDFRAGPSRTYDAVMRGFDITGEYKW
ncbi:MAG: TonB-dependent receptor, partial [Pseudomonadota bacterium]